VHKGKYGAQYVYLNEGLVPEEEAKISVFDHGFLYGAGVFETMRSYNKELFLVKEHLIRLRKSAEIFAINIPWQDEELMKALNVTIEANNLNNAYLRLSISRGEGPIGLDPKLCPKPTLVIMAKELPEYNQEIYGKGIKAIICETKRNSLGSTNPQAKSFNFLNNIAAKIEVNAAGASEGIMLNHRGELTEGTVSNIFLVKNNILLTPRTDVGILEGITRNFVIALAKENHLEVNEEILYPNNLLDADEVFITNSTQEIVPIIEVNHQRISSGIPGEITVKLLELYRNIAWVK
jgi:branched-chain amino acid aminotransferase